jgi:hypothetical protein
VRKRTNAYNKNKIQNIKRQADAMTPQDKPRQLLHLVFGGELETLGGTEFKNLSELDIVGIFPDYASAVTAWKAKAQQTVDNAHMRYFIVHMHRLLDPASGGN